MQNANGEVGSREEMMVAEVTTAEGVEQYTSLAEAVEAAADKVCHYAAQRYRGRRNCDRYIQKEPDDRLQYPLLYGQRKHGGVFRYRNQRVSVLDGWFPDAEKRVYHLCQSEDPADRPAELLQPDA